MDVLLVLLAIFILVCFGLLKLVVDNIGIILLILVIGIVFFVCLFKRPVETFFIALVLGIIALFASCGMMLARENNVPVTISKATKACQVYDQDNNLIEIPAGAIVARYRDEDERVTAHANGGLYVGFLSTCCWYYKGSTHTFTESVVSDNNSWHLEEIAVIKITEFRKGDWKNIDTSG